MGRVSKQRVITLELFNGYIEYLKEAERAPGTIQKYRRAIDHLVTWLDGAPATKELILAWKRCLCDRGMAPSSVNSSIAAANGLFRYAGWNDLQMRYMRVQHRAFRDSVRDLTVDEYLSLVRQAYAAGDVLAALAMETIASTGIRVSELEYITVDAVCEGRAAISLKGKIRVILLPDRLRVKLKEYCDSRGLQSGPVIVDKDGHPYSRRLLWGRMKRLCAGAGVNPEKVFPHNLRHLFAVTFYKASGDIVKLADVLGHSSVETTRIYLATSGEEHRKTLDGLGLIV